jgi:excisionase family DNA binding protein
MNNARTVLSLREAATHLGIGLSHLRKFIDSGDIRTFKIGRRRLISIQALNDFVSQLEEQGGIHTPAAGANDGVTA